MKFPFLFALLALPAAAVAEEERGKEVYEETCIACHGEDGSGALPGITPDLTPANGPLSQEEEVLVKHIIEGFESPGSQMAMPPKGGNDELTEEDVRNVLRYMQESFMAR
jgi:cytochrome c5